MVVIMWAFDQQKVTGLLKAKGCANQPFITAKGQLSPFVVIYGNNRTHSAGIRPHKTVAKNKPERMSGFPGSGGTTGLFVKLCARQKNHQKFYK